MTKQDKTTAMITMEGPEGPVTVSLETLEKAVDAITPSRGKKILFKKSIEWLPCKLTDKEVMDKAQEMAAHHSQKERLTNELAQIRTEFKARIEKEDAEIRSLSIAIANREERRDVKCQWWLNFPKKGEKALVRLDTGEKVRTQIMTDADMQGELAFGGDKE